MAETEPSPPAPSSARLLEVAQTLHRRLSHWHDPDVLEMQPLDEITAMDVVGFRFKKNVRPQPDPPTDSVRIFAFDQGPLVPVDEEYPETWEKMDVPDSYQDVAGIATHVPPSLTDRNATWQWMGVFLWNLNLFPSHPAVEYVGAVFQQILELPMYLRGEIPQSLHPLPDRPYYMAGRPVPVELLDQLVAAAEKLHDLAGPLQGESPTATSESSNHKLIVDLLRLVAIDSVSGETIELPSAQSARWLKVLADNEGVWISSSALKEHDAELDGVRTDRLLKLLPEGLAAKIQTSKQHGSRLLNS